MVTINRIDVLSLGQALGGIAGIIGLVAGLLYGVGGAIYDALTGGLNWGSVLALGAIIGMPLIFGFAGLIGGLAGGLLYNLTAASFGGVQVTLDQQE